MPKHRKQRMLRVAWVMGVVGCALGLMLWAMRSHVSFYVTPSKLLQHRVGDHPPSLRLGGLVVKGSVRRHPQDPLRWEFSVTDFQHACHVVYRGVMPALFREGQGVVVDGHCMPPSCRTFQATRVLAKHDASYHPPEVPKPPAAKRHGRPA